MAALHYNENSEREQATTAEGTLRYNIADPKYKKGGYVVKKVSEQQTFSMLRWYVLSLSIHSHFSIDYVKELMDRTVQLCKGDKRIETPNISPPHPLAKTFERPEKAVAIIKHTSRFSH